MKLSLITGAAIALTACTQQTPTCGPTEAVVISYTKTGLPIYDDQSPILPPCSTATRVVEHEPPTHNPPHSPEPPTPEPPVGHPPNDEPQKGKHPNSGRGNGSELDDNGNDVDPGNSGGKNKGGD